MKKRLVVSVAWSVGAVVWVGCAAEGVVSEQDVAGASAAVAVAAPALASYCSGVLTWEGEIPGPPEGFEDCFVYGSNGASICCDSEGFECGDPEWFWSEDPETGFCGGVWNATISCKGEQVDCDEGDLWDELIVNGHI